MKTATKMDTKPKGGNADLYDKWATSDGHKQLCEIVVAVEELAKLVNGFLNEHGEACRCDHCRYRRRQECETKAGLTGELRGAKWALGVLEAFLSNYVVPAEILAMVDRDE